MFPTKPTLFVCLFGLLGSCKSSQQTKANDWPFTLSDTKQTEWLERASTWIGVPYRFGGTTRQGVDCSGLVLAISQASLPRTSKEMHKACTTIQPKEAKTGDLIFFRFGGKTINHVGLVLEPPWFIHASSSSGVVVNQWTSDHYQKWLAGFGRIPKK